GDAAIQGSDAQFRACGARAVLAIRGLQPEPHPVAALGPLAADGAGPQRPRRTSGHARFAGSPLGGPPSAPLRGANTAGTPTDFRAGARPEQYPRPGAAGTDRVPLLPAHARAARQGGAERQWPQSALRSLGLLRAVGDRTPDPVDFWPLEVPGKA